VVISLRELQLFIGLVDPGTDSRCLAKVEGRIFDGSHLSRGDEGAINRRELIGIDLDHMSADITMTP